MYEAYYGLRERPFDLTPDPRYLFLTPKHQEALTTLEYGISRTKSYQLVKDYLCGRGEAANSELLEEDARV